MQHLRSGATIPVSSTVANISLLQNVVALEKEGLSEGRRDYPWSTELLFLATRPRETPGKRRLPTCLYYGQHTIE
jgi:hypothetical protein